MLRAREDARLAVEELRREPAAAIFARAHAGPRASEDEALFRTVLLGLLIATAEACGGFDWDDEAFERAYAELEASLFGERRRYVAIAPLVGLSLAKPVELATGLRLRPFVTGELVDALARVARAAAARSSARSRIATRRRRAPARAGRRRGAARRGRRDRGRGERAAAHDRGGRSQPGRCSSRRSTGGPFGIQPVLPIAATQPPGEPSRLDAFRAPIAVDVLAALGDADGDPELAEALDRWELSLFQTEPFRAEQLRAALAALLGETWPMRCCVLLAEDARRARGAVRRADGARRRRRRDAATVDAVAARGRRRPALARPRAARARARSRAARARPRGRLRARSPSDAVSARIRYPAASGRGLRRARGRIAGRARATGADRGAGSAGADSARARRRARARCSPRPRRGRDAEGGDAGARAVDGSPVGARA